MSTTNLEQSLPFSNAQLSQLSQFCSYIEKNPNVIHNDKLQFFKDFLIDMGADVSPHKLNLKINKEEKKDDEPKRKPVIQEMDEGERKEEQILKDQKDDELPAHYLSNMGDTFISNKESMKQAVEVKSRAVQAFRNEEYHKSALLFGRAIYLSGGKFPPLFMKRAECLHLLGKHMSARRDATKSIELHEVNHRAYKVRGKCNAALSQWAEAVHDFQKALKYEPNDEEAQTLLQDAKKHVEPDQKSIYLTRDGKVPRSAASSGSSSSGEVSRTSKKKSQESSQKTTSKKPQHTKSAFSPELDESKKQEAVSKIQNDEKLLKAFSDPKVSKMVDDISKDPSMFFKYQKSNPEVTELFGSFLNLMGNKGGNK